MVAAAFAAAAPAAAGRRGRGGGAEAGRHRELPEARAAAITAADPAAALAPWVVPGSALARTEAQGRGRARALRGQSAGRTVESASCRVTVRRQPAGGRRSHGGGRRARRHAPHVAFAERHDGHRGQRRRPHPHAAPAAATAGSSRPTPTPTSSRPACLEAAGASRALRTRRRRAASERAARPLRAARASAAPAAAIPARRYTDIISYDRPAAQDYADTYALSYNPTFVRFAGADCANFASQCARAGDMPQSSRRDDQRLVVRQGGHVLSRRTTRTA